MIAFGTANTDLVQHLAEQSKEEDSLVQHKEFDIAGSALEPYELGFDEPPATLTLKQDLLVEASPVSHSAFFPYNTFLRGQAEADLYHRIHKSTSNSDVFIVPT